MRKSSIFLAALVLSGKAFAVEIVSRDLKQIIESKNERVVAKGKERQAAEFREGYFVRSYLPKLNVYGAQESFEKGTRGKKEQPSYGAEATLNLFNGGRDYLEGSKRELTTKRKVFERQVTIAEELDKARETYWHILFLKEKTALLEEARNQNDTNLKSASRRINSGVATETDRVEFEMEEINLKQESSTAQLELKNLVKNLTLILGFESGEELEFPEPLSHEHKWEEMLVHSHAEHDFIVKPKVLMSEEADKLAKISSRSFWPRLEAYAGWKQFNEREEEFANPKERQESVIGLRLTLDLFDGFNSSREASALKEESAAALAEANYHKREIEIHIQNELAELKLLHAQVHEAEENIKRAQRYYSLTLSEYVRGVKNSPDVLGATEKLYDMKEKYLAIVRDFQIAKSHVMSKIGR